MNAQRIVRREATGMLDTWPKSVHPVLRRVYAARGVTTPGEIDHRLASLLPPDTLGGIDTACALLEEALRGGQRIVIVGDFDADGATGTAVAVRGLRALGAADVGYTVPNRMRHGYGLSPAIVEEILPRQPRLLITVDNGIAAHAGVAAARTHGMRVIVTDHHLPGASLPDADAIVNPNAAGDGFASKALAGVGVMFYLLLALRARLRRSGWFAERAEPDLSALLDLVALGTVADLVPLDYNNRILVAAGLRRIRAGRACAGIGALLEDGKRDPARVVASDLAFAVAPRINAAGRLEDMSIGIECLLCDDPARARQLVGMLGAINSERRELQSAMVDQATEAVRDKVSVVGAEGLPHGVVLFDPQWHQGVVGLVASKLKEALGRPVIACAPAGEGTDEVKASGRSIPGFHLRDALAEIDARQPGLLLRFGGHAMAAGLSLRRESIEAFTTLFDCVVRERLEAGQLNPELRTDGELGADDFNLDLAQQLRFGGPWGQGFPEPLFDGAFSVDEWKVVGETHLRLVLRANGAGAPVSAMYFNAAELTPPPGRLRAVYQLEADEWNGAARLRVLIRHAFPAA
jgi:single-stranded-DNA-specific exonuclease